MLRCDIDERPGGKYATGVNSALSVVLKRKRFDEELPVKKV